MTPGLIAAFAATAVGLAALSSCSSGHDEPAVAAGPNQIVAGPGQIATQVDQMVWTDVEGKAQASNVIASSQGPEHCNWQSVTFLWVGEDPRDGGTQYVRDPEGVLPARRLAPSYAPDVELPPRARDTGFRRDGAALWVTAKAAYLVSPASTERWPRPVDHWFACA